MSKDEVTARQIRFTLLSEPERQHVCPKPESCSSSYSYSSSAVEAPEYEYDDEYEDD